MAEDAVLNYLNNTNRPWNITNVTVRPRGAKGQGALRRCVPR